MKKLGLVGGIGPESTIDYYRGIIAGYRQRLAQDTYPQMVIDSLNLKEMYTLSSTQQWDKFADRIIDSLKNLSAAGAEFAAIGANTAHIVFDEVNSRSPVPLVSLVEATCQYAQAKGCKRVVVLGTAFTMSSGLYTDALAKFGIDAFVPDKEQQQVIHNIIFPNLQAGIVLQEEKEAMLRIASQMIKATDADALVLGCTELPLIIKEGDLDTLLLDTTQIHIEAILDYMLA
ncbi:MAG: amino acid racemase [Firmicutes bacterium]|nr:amino acid racemase [Bacillota bacterium]